MHQTNKIKIYDFLKGHFYGLDEAGTKIEDVVIFVTGGDYEYKNRGMFLTIQKEKH